MRRKEQEITDRSEILDIISEAAICRLGMADGDEPYIVPMNFGFRDNTFHLHGARSGRKIDILRKNPRVCLEIDIPTELEPAQDGKACNFGFTYRSLVARGTVRFLENIDEKKDGLTVIVKKYAPENPCDFPEASLKSTAVITVQVEEMTAKRSS